MLLASWYDSSYAYATSTSSDYVVYQAPDSGGGDSPPTHIQSTPGAPRDAGDISIQSCDDEPVSLPSITVHGSIPSSFGPSLRIVSGSDSSTPDEIFHRRLVDVNWQFIAEVDATDHNVSCPSSYQARWDAARESIPESPRFQMSWRNRRGWYDVHYNETDHQRWLVTSPFISTLGLDLAPPKPCKSDGGG